MFAFGKHDIVGGESQFENTFMNHRTIAVLWEYIQAGAYRSGTNNNGIDTEIDRIRKQDFQHIMKKQNKQLLYRSTPHEYT